MPTPVLATKLFPPTRRSASVARGRLAALMDSTLNAGHRLTLVSAPAGFGKSTLVSDWAAHLMSDDVRAGWFSLDDDDNALPRFLAHLWAALSGIGVEMNPETLELLVAASPSEAMTEVVNTAAQAEQQRPDSHWVLVLDDYHSIEAPEVHEALTFLLEHAPDQFHLVVITRSDPPFPLSKLRTRGLLTEVRAADLRFTPGEARAFLNEVMGLHLTESEVQALDERTEGWIAGLQLAALSLRGVDGRGDVVDFIGAFTGSNRFVIDYLMDEVLARQSADVREFLLRTAVLDRLTGPLCDEVTGRTDSLHVLQDLDRGNLFLIPLDADRSWYRYHHLFGDVLRARLMAEQPEQVPKLHRAASDWLAAHDLVADAVHHALAGGDDDRAAFLMESALPQVRRTRQDGLLIGWVRSLPDPVIRRNPVLSILSAWSLMMAGDLDGMERRLDDAETALAAGDQNPALTATWADTEDLRSAPASLWVYRAALAQARGDRPATAQHARRALELAGPDDHVVRGGANGYLGLAAWTAGDVPDALATFSDAMRSLHAAGNLTDELDMTVVLGDMWLSAGRPSRARRLYEQALKTATGPGEAYARATADLHVGLAELDREAGKLASAATHLEAARVFAERRSITENRYRWYVASAQLRLTSGDPASAEELLDQAEALYRPGFYPYLRPISAMRARFHVVAGDLAATEEWAVDHGVTTEGEVAFLHEYDHLTLVRLVLARHQRTGAVEAAEPSLGEVLALLDRLQSDAEPARAGSLLEIGILRALTYETVGRRGEALVELDRALRRAPEPDAYVRLFLDEGDLMLALLRAAASSGGSGELGMLRQHARRLLAAADAGQPAAAGRVVGVSLPDPLSEREVEVVRLLDSDLTGPEIAERLFVSLNTFRTHTKRIFTKLDVTTRIAAVRHARELGLL